MLDTGTLMTAAPPEKPWRERVTDGLVGCFQTLAQSITENGHEDALRFDRVKSSPKTLCLKVRNEGQSALVMLFDGVGVETWQAYHRAKLTLSEMSGSGLIPDLIAVSDPRRFLLFRASGTELKFDRENPENKEKVAHRIGQWLAHVDALCPQQEACGNWYDYLRKTQGETGIAPSPRAVEALTTVPLCGLGLARDRSALAALSVTEEGALNGWDFDQTVMRPRGWDYVLTYRDLLQTYRARGNGILAALSDGFASGHVGGLMIDELDQVARSLATAR